MSNQVITRFAPSPTGFLHIGGARTALFNWLYAKAHNGKMLLRIEDTDRERSSQEAVDAIKEGLQWLGLDWDGDAISQYSRAERHREVANKMIENGTAYRCYATQEELNAMREKARAEGRPPRYDGTYRDITAEEIAAKGSAPFAVRLRAPLEGETVIEDQVQGTVRFPNKDLDDLVLLRSDGTPTYMLAVVVDDHDMGVTHVIRGDDHLTNAARQTLIFQANGWDVPTMAHIPLIHGADGAKLSKRHGAIGAEKYREMGYVPEGLRNYLVKLGWAHGDDEIMSTDQMIEWFGFDGMNKAPARFDFQKLDAINGHHIRHMDDEVLLGHLEAVLDYIEGGKHISDNLNEESRKQLLLAMPSLKERAKTLVALAQGAAFIFDTRPLDMEEKAAKFVTDETREMIREILPAFEAVEDWTPTSIEEVIRGFAESKDLKLGKVAPPLRAALTGKAASPGAFDVLNVLGKSESVARLKDQL
ncbi:MAG: glutamate--tRNA ligase [Pseudomonadota bacterium]